MSVINLLFNIIKNADLNSGQLKYFKMKWGAVEEDIHGCVRGLDRKIPNCKLAMHANGFDEILKSMIHDLRKGILVIATD